MRETAARLLDEIARRGTGELRADYAEPATAATVCGALGIPDADWAPVIRPAGEAAFGVVRPPAGLAGAQDAWHGIWGYYRRVIDAKRAGPDGGLVSQMHLAMQQAGYTIEETVRAVATISNGATALLPVLERVLLWLLRHPRSVAQVSAGERTWPQLVREAITAGALFPVTPPLVAGKDARIGRCPVPEGTLVLPSLASAVRHPRAGAWLAFGPGPHRCPGDELTLAALEEYAAAFFRRYPGARLTSTRLDWRDGPLSTPRKARFAVGSLARPGTGPRAAGARVMLTAPRAWARPASRACSAVRTPDVAARRCHPHARPVTGPPRDLHAAGIWPSSATSRRPGSTAQCATSPTLVTRTGPGPRRTSGWRPRTSPAPTPTPCSTSTGTATRWTRAPTP
jgi:hypothetical protein